MNLRRKALSLLLEMEARKTYINLSVASAAEDLAEKDRRFLTALVYGAVERKITLDYYIGALCGRSPVDLSAHTRNLLRLGLYQLLYMDGVPPFAAVHETVALAENPGERGFLNGVLREAQRQEKNLPLPSREKSAARFFSVFYSMPLWIVKHFLALYGEEETEALLASFLSHPPLTLAVHIGRISRQKLLALFHEAGIAAEETPFSDIGIRVLANIPPTLLPGYREGWFWVQDEASQICGMALSPEAGQRVLDLCACPGGKSFGAAVRMQNSGSLRAYDLHESKLPLTREGAARLGLSIITAQAQDATVLCEALVGQADRVICDVPCSGLGVLAKKPDLRYREKEGMEALPPLQYAILENAALYVRRGGILVYSTCTLSPAENEAQVARFLREHQDFRPVDFSAGTLSSANGMLTLLPHRHQTDGFFVAKLEKV